ncbi:hypothetical protein [Cupriavidus necator]|uniref:hypothetical protein n=1 Tax=Cupriavidus necator TaxID=106590 RepID=UPI000AEEDBE0|nr:hypothetical protein [Cupriavidus necator]
MAAFMVLLGVLFSRPTMAATSDSERAQNLATCLTGRYPALCKKYLLSADEARMVESAEHRENLKTCLTGRYPSLCNRSKLTSDEAQQVLAAEKRENLKTCLTGRYRALCKKNLLSEAELKQVTSAELAENARFCLDGRYPSLCNKSQLTKEQLSQVQAAESRATTNRQQYAARSPVPRARRFSASGCESGHWVESVSSDGEIVILENQSVWQVDAADAIDSMLWLPTTDIVACDDKLINTDDNETVSATRIR